MNIIIDLDGKPKALKLRDAKIIANQLSIAFKEIYYVQEERGKFTKDYIGEQRESVKTRS